ncbi:MAG TPA: hypothetical protein VFU47_17325, partial [Armatimonadota bacterium]|nr:hypothetical protein [Armatimonadota bacterium]
MITPLMLSLDGRDWTLYHLPPGEWRERRIWQAEAPGGAASLPAPVPGHVQSALRALGELPDPYLGRNGEQWSWTGRQDWVYEKRFAGPPAASGLRFHLRFEAIDGHAHVYLNGERVGEHHARFLPAEWEVT